MGKLKTWLITAIIASVVSFILFGMTWYVLNPKAVIYAITHFYGASAAKFVFSCVLQGAIVATALEVSNRR